MSWTHRLILIAAGLFGLYVAMIAMTIGSEILREPQAWMGTGDGDQVFGWLFVLILGGGLTGLVGIFSVLAALIAVQRRRAVLWLLVIPGFLGLLVAIASVVIVWQLPGDLQAYLPPVALGLFVPHLVAFLLGRTIRRRTSNTAEVIG